MRQGKLDRYRSREEQAGFLEKYREMVNVVDVLDDVRDCRDPKDDKFLSLVLAAKADLVVPSDADLQVLNPYRGIPVLSPAQVMAPVWRTHYCFESRRSGRPKSKGFIRRSFASRW